MDERKPSIPSSEFRLRSAPPGTPADIDPPPAELSKSAELVAVERQSLSEPNEPRQNDFSDGPSVAVYYRNEKEVSEGVLIALSAMGVALASTSDVRRLQRCARRVLMPGTCQAGILPGRRSRVR